MTYTFSRKVQHPESRLYKTYGTDSEGSDVPRHNRFRVLHAFRSLIHQRSPADNLLQDCRVPVTMDEASKRVSAILDGSRDPASTPGFPGEDAGLLVRWSA